MNSKGYTLVELIVVMAIFVAIMMLGSSAFERIIATAGQQTKSAESSIEGIVGLQLLRADVEHAGYGLPWTFQNASTVNKYVETSVSADSQANGVDSRSFNDVPPARPRCIISGISSKEANGVAGTDSGKGPDYLVIKSSVAGMTASARKWAYVKYSSSGVQNKSYIRSWGSEDDLVAGERVITISSAFSTTGTQTKLLVMNGDNFSYEVPASKEPPAAYKPGDESQVYAVYGIDDAKNPRMPYNRADYYIKRPASNVPQSCNPGTGILYKAVVSHGSASGDFTEYPLLDCVGDLQVMFELDPDKNGNLVYTDDISALTAQQVRDQLTKVRIFILAHEGKKDRDFTYPYTNADEAIIVGDQTLKTLGRVWKASALETVFGSDWRNYRWKVYTISVKPKNLS